MSATPRVLYSFPGRLGRTGIGTTAWYQAQGLIDEGVEVHVYCGKCDRPLKGAARIVETLRAVGLRIPYRLLGTERAWRWHDRAVAKALRRGAEVDLVHCWPYGAESTLKVAGARGIPSFLERPNTHTAFAFDVVAKELRALGMDLPMNHSHRYNAGRLAQEESEYALADFILCPAEFVAKTFLERGFPEEKLARTQYGYDPSRFKPVPRNGESGGKLVVGFVGSCEPRKGLHFALKAWKEAALGNTGEFRIYGTFVPGYREMLGSLLDMDNVKDFGFVDDVPAAMSQCDVLILPSIEEGSALVTYEARACRCVLMVSDAAGARCTDMHDGLIHSAGDVGAIARQFQRLGTDRPLLERLRAASIAGVHDLTWSAAAQRLLRAYTMGLAARRAT